MIYFCADDYGIAQEGNRHIETCLAEGALNKVSVLPNGDLDEFQESLLVKCANISLHLDLVEGRPLAKPEEVPLLLDESGCFKYSFVGLFLQAFSPKRRELEKQLYKEIKSQIRFWQKCVGEKNAISIDSHQHTHMIPWIFKTLIRVIKEEAVDVAYMRISEEPIMPYLLTPSLYMSYRPVGIIKQWLLKFLAIWNYKELKKTGIKPTYFMGLMFSGKLTEEKIKKLLPHYEKLSKKKGRAIEIAFHPGYLEESKAKFEKFYKSPWRKKEYDELINWKN